MLQTEIEQQARIGLLKSRVKKIPSTPDKKPTVGLQIIMMMSFKPMKFRMNQMTIMMWSITSPTK